MVDPRLIEEAREVISDTRRDVQPYVRDLLTRLCAALEARAPEGWPSTICDANQLIDGWEQKGVELTDWDKGVRQRLSKMARELEGATNDVESTDTAARLRVRDEVRPQNGLDGAEDQTDSESTPAQDGALELVPRKISTARGLNDGPSPSARDVVPTASDITAQLRNARMMVNHGNGDVRDEPDPLHEQAADEIDRLTKELAVEREITAGLTWAVERRGAARPAPDAAPAQEGMVDLAEKAVMKAWYDGASMLEPHAMARSLGMAVLAALPSAPTPGMGEDMGSLLAAIRGYGWLVAVHNDYLLGGERHTFWLFTNEGRALKGEARTDAEALSKVLSALTGDGARRASPAEGGGE